MLTFEGDVADFAPQKEGVDRIEVWSFAKIKDEIKNGNSEIARDSIACFEELATNFENISEDWL